MYIRNKKAGLLDLFVFMIGAFILAIACGLYLYLATVTEEKLHENEATIQRIIPNDNATELIDNTFGKVPDAYQTLKWVTSVIIIGMAMSILITSFLVRSTPIFFIPYIFIWIMAIIISVPISNAYETIYETPMLTATFSGFWGQTFIFLNLHIWVTVIGGLAALIMFVNMIRTGSGGEFA